MDAKTVLSKKKIKYKIIYFSKKKSFLSYFFSFFKSPPPKEVKLHLLSSGKEKFALLTLRKKELNMKKVKAQLGKAVKEMSAKSVRKLTKKLPISVDIFSLPKNTKLRIDNEVFRHDKILLPSSNLFYGFEIRPKDLEKLRPFEIVVV